MLLLILLFFFSSDVIDVKSWALKRQNDSIFFDKIVSKVVNIEVLHIFFFALVRIWKRKI